MNLSLILVACLFCYKLIIADSLLSIFELSSVPLTGSQPTSNKRGFSLLDLARKMTEPEMLVKDSEGKTIINELNLTLEVDKPDFMFQSYYTNQVMLAYITQIDQSTSNVTLKTIDFSNHGLETSRKLYITKCLELSFPGKITEMKHQSSKLLVRTEQNYDDTGETHDWVHVVQALDCTDRKHLHPRDRYMIRDDSMVINTNLSQLVGVGKTMTGLILVQNVLLGMIDGKELVAIEPIMGKVLRITHKIQECQRIVKFSAVDRWIVLVCYRGVGLKVETNIIVANTGGGRYGLFLHSWDQKSQRLMKVTSKSLTSYTRWRNMEEYLGYAEMIQVEACQMQSSVVVAVKNQAIWIIPTDFKAEISGKEIPLKYTDKLTFGLDGAAHLVAAYTTGTTKVVIQDVPNSYGLKNQDQVAVFQNSYFKDILVIRSSASRAAYILTLDDSKGLSLYRIADQLSPHQSWRQLIDMVGRGAASWSELAIYCYLFRVFIGMVHRVWIGEIWKKRGQQDQLDPEKQAQKEYITELHKSLKGLSVANHASLLTPLKKVVDFKDTQVFSEDYEIHGQLPIEPHYDERLEFSDVCYLDKE